MRTAAEPVEVRRPSAVRVLTTLLAVTAAATVVAELLNYWYAPEQEFGLAVRTGWAMLRSLGFLVLIGHVNRSRVAAKPFGLILAITTVFAVGRLVVPRAGVPPLPGLLGFGVLTALCLAVVVLLYRSDAVGGHLVRHRKGLVVENGVLSWREVTPKRAPVTGWLLTARVAAFTYSPLMLVPALVAGGSILDGRLSAVPAVLFWSAAGVAVSWLVLFCTEFVVRNRAWARKLLVLITLGTLAVDLPLCWWLLGLDGLIRDGAPLLTAALLTLYSLHRATPTPTPTPTRARRS
ncbi:MULTISPECIES: hypothetical protein [Micromonospora]|uniref:Uncharacterized protein n=1 Tax=Micromonospora solifontis TaxID=2487138 RepID=A0ABX9WLH1_9ACTN|nr:MULTISPECIES: hypothetical protein [Micromonospora]NES14341.1 hypothetical protein [Micromonospora sp. PPF5-17B]NES35051.1 hypothetical protein [Micromonospora solifontis]NES57449.1 hypothetical protein [Micromonospora sp. PPF5-6]RNM01322.1 hypothetical protein EFE23_02545 [Micromonospora solifontis]